MTPLLTREWPRLREARRKYVDAIFHRIAPRYDRLTRILSFGQDRRWKEAAIVLLPPPRPGGVLLDLATGTAELPLIARARGRPETVIALDRSRAMLARGRAKAEAAGADRILFVTGDLNAIPVAPSSFDAILIGYGLRYPLDLRGALEEIHRALRPGGVFVALDFGRPPHALVRRLLHGYLLVTGALWGLLLHGKPGTYWHIVESLRAYPGQRALARMMEEIGFDGVTVTDRLWGSSALVRGVRRGAEGPPSPAGAGVTGAEGACRPRS